MSKYIYSVLGIVLIGIVGVALADTARPWPRGAWDAADHNRDGILARDEMVTFGQQKSHRNGPRLMMHFDRADTNQDRIVDSAEIEAYGYQIGSKDPNDHLPTE